MEKIIEAIIIMVALLAIARYFRGGRMPNVDEDTGLDHHPIPTQEEMDNLGEKYNFTEEREF